MEKYHFLKTIKTLRFHKKYLFFSAGYGLTTLIIPFSIQYLVNNLSLAGIWTNTIVFLMIIAVGLSLSHLFKYSQFILNEHIQREIFMDQMNLWSQKKSSKVAHYYFDSISAMKSFSLTLAQFIDIALVTSIGLLALLFLHPIFIILLILLFITLLCLKSFWKDGLITSLEESNIKYDLHHKLQEESLIEQSDFFHFLEKRNRHFLILKKSKFLLLNVNIVSQLSFLAIGIYLIQNSSLSIGQFVSAEIIITTVLTSLAKIPKTLESLYDFETSMIKVHKAIEKE